ncbi:MAG TPA: protoporphyrinogen oxidase, partial [Actinomycetota bacterium]
MSASRARRVVVVGGGVTGLTVAYRLMQADPAIDVTVLEAGSAAGGKLRNVTVGDLVLPAGADSFLARKPWAVELCRELGIELETPGATGAYLWTDTGLVPLIKDAPFGIPGEIGDLMRWPGLSGAGKRRAAQDLLRRPRRSDRDESLGSLLRRRFGDEATDLAVGPLLAGLYAGDVDRLSVQATFPDLQAWERAQGSLFRGSQATSKLARRSQLG